MLLEIFCGFVFCHLFRCFFFDDKKEFLQLDSSDSSVFYVATRLEKIYGGKAYVGLRIPDADSGSRQDIDIVLVAKDAVWVISVRNFCGSVDIDMDGNWICNGEERHPDPVEETKRQVAILKSYLEQSGVTLPEGYLIGRVVLPNPNSRIPYSIDCLPEVISCDKWSQLAPKLKTRILKWFKGAFRRRKNNRLEGMYQKLRVILSTAPMWDRLKLKGDKSVLGKFIKFKGKPEDMQALINVERSMVSQLLIRKSSLFGTSGSSKIKVLYAPRDCRGKRPSASEWKKATVESNTLVIFKKLSSKKVSKIELSSVSKIELSSIAP